MDKSTKKRRALMKKNLVDTYNHSIVLFDGVCNFCNQSVQFIIKHDSKGRFFFASLQSDIAVSVMEEYSHQVDLGSIVLIEKEKVYFSSTAVLFICRKLDGFWKLAYVLIIIPRPIRDAFYRWFAKRRYKFFGKRETCMIPTLEIRNRFLEMNEKKGE